MRNKPAPIAKWAIRDFLLLELYNPVEERKQRDTKVLVEKNVVLLQAEDMQLHKKVLPEHFHRSFAYNGQFYSIEQDSGPRNRNWLHKSLEPEMQEFLTHYGNVTEERLMVSGFFDSMLATFPAPGDWLQILPQTLHEPLQAYVTAPSWDPVKTPAEIDAFMAKHKPRYDLIRQRMAINLIL